MVTANSVKFNCVIYKIFPSNTGEPSRSTFDAKGLLFGLRSRHYCGNTIISFVLLSVETIWAAKHLTKVHHWAKPSRLPSNRTSDTYDLFWCLSSTSQNHVTWRQFWNGSIAPLSHQSDQNGIILPCMYFHFKSMRISFISKVTRVHKAKTVANDTSLCFTICFGFMNFIPVDRAEMSHMNRQQNSTR